MIRVTIYKNEKHQCVGFKAHGHAGFSEEGQDIVCAAVSVLTINTLNAIEKFADDRTSLVSDESKGLIDYRLKGNPVSDTHLPHITMHGLRHMFATILIEQSVSLEKISKLMGHKSVATTFEIYCGIMEAKKEIAKTIDSVMDPAIGAVKVRSKGGIVCM